MANPYFRNLPEIAYVNRDDPKSNSEYNVVKNFFKRAKLREDILQNIAFFEKFIIKGDDRPDNIAFEIYGDSTLDWVVLMSNNIINIQSEWPMPNDIFYDYLIDKYGDETTLYGGVHHYEANEVKTSNNKIIIASGTRVSVGQSVSFYDFGKQDQVTVTDVASPITNFIYEQNLNDKKREIFLLKPTYVNLLIDDLEEIMTYKKGSTQFIDRTLVQGDNIRLFD